MPDALDIEITDGGPVTVTILGKVHPLAYPMHNVMLFKQQTGKSLFDAQTWPQIDLEENGDLWLACLWAGLHEKQPDKTWKAPYTTEELDEGLEFSSARIIARAMVKALTRYMPKAQNANPNAQAPAAGSLPAQSEVKLPSTSPGSGAVQNADSVLVATNS
jgi:hypothetical protein